nr:hypothetical protein HmN_000881500 [Hymenolepis microstoma]
MSRPRISWRLVATSGPNSSLREYRGSYQKTLLTRPSSLNNVSRSLFGNSTPSVTGYHPHTGNGGLTAFGLALLFYPLGRSSCRVPSTSNLPTDLLSYPPNLEPVKHSSATFSGFPLHLKYERYCAHYLPTPAKLGSRGIVFIFPYINRV